MTDTFRHKAKIPVCNREESWHLEYASAHQIKTSMNQFRILKLYTFNWFYRFFQFGNSTYIQPWALIVTIQHIFHYRKIC